MGSADVDLSDASPGCAPTGEQRLQRALAATLKRNLERPALDVEAFDGSKIARAQRGALAFLVSNMAHVEATSVPNLAALAACAPVPSISACFAAQIQDELAHGAMLERWLTVYDQRVAPHLLTRIGIRAAAITQHHAWLGISNAEILTEHYAAALLDELMVRVEEPCLRCVFGQIKKDEQRHKIIAVESVRLLRERGAHRTLVARLLGPVVELGTLMYFRQVFSRYLDRPCAALDLSHARILERALDEVHDAVRDGARA
jgi:hypothetical protein